MNKIDDLVDAIGNSNLNNPKNMAIPITSCEINIIPKFSGDSRELPLFLELANNLYTRYEQNANVPNSFLLDCIKSRLEGEPLRVVASRGINTKDGVFQALREMYSDPRSECTLELDITNFIPKSRNITIIGNELRELITFYDSKVNTNVMYNDAMKIVKSQVFRQMALQAYLKSIMLMNNRLGEYLINKDIQNLDQAICLARNHDEWLKQFEKYSRLNKNNTTIIQNGQKQNVPKMQQSYSLGTPNAQNRQGNQIYLIHHGKVTTISMKTQV